MKPTGIVRRMDDLGRIVMPKELRRTLHIRDGDPLELYISENSIILKRYTPQSDEIGDYAQNYAKTLSEVTGHIALIANNDVFMAVAGVPQREFLDKPIPVSWVKKSQNAPSDIFELEDEDTQKNLVVAYATIVNNDKVIGTVFLLSREPSASMGNLELKLTDTAATFIAKQMKQKAPTVLN